MGARIKSSSETTHVAMKEKFAERTGAGREMKEKSEGSINQAQIEARYARSESHFHTLPTSTNPVDQSIDLFFFGHVLAHLSCPSGFCSLSSSSTASLLAIKSGDQNKGLDFLLAFLTITYFPSTWVFFFPFAVFFYFPFLPLRKGKTQKEKENKNDKATMRRGGCS